MTKRSRAAVVVALCVAVLGVTQTPAMASAASNADRPDPAIAAALERIASKTHTAADLALIKTEPDLAAKVADPGNVKVAVDGPPGLKALVGPGNARPTGAIDAEGCWWIRVTITSYSLLGFDLYKWAHYIEFCLEPMSHITRWVTRYDQMLYADNTIYVRELVANSATPAGTFAITSTMQRHLEQCVVRFGCYANHYPWSSIHVRADGLWAYNWGT
jgi:hypothetical protein